MNIEQALIDLGNSSEEVARSLKDKGIKGGRMCGGSCPIANYVLSLDKTIIGVNASQHRCAGVQM
jgi:hypothetical protein